jgi:hypothetical protein
MQSVARLRVEFTMCVTGIGCVIGAPVAAIGFAEAVEAKTYFDAPNVEEGFNPIREPLRAAVGNKGGDIAYAALSVGFGTAVLKADTVVTYASGVQITTPELQVLSNTGFGLNATALGLKAAAPGINDHAR